MAKDDNSHDTNQPFDTGSVPELNHVPANIPQENLAFLKGLIDSFNASTAKLKEAYTALQEKVENLNLQLEETNRDLSASLMEQERLSNYLTNILESLSSGVLVVDTSGIITLFNRGAETITGIKVDDALHSHYREVMGSETPEELTPLSSLSTGEGHSQIEKNLISKSGKTIPVGCSISPLVNKSGDMVGAVEIFMDMTRIKALEDELAWKEKLAALGQMAATMAHKIRNPLGGIAGFAGLLQLELKGNENNKRLLGRIIEGVDKLERIVTSLLSYTSPLKLKPDIVNLAEIAADKINSLKEDYDSVQFNIKEPEDSVMIEADAKQLSDAVASIARNAVEAIEGKGTVEIITIPGESVFKPPHSVTAQLVKTIRKTSEFIKLRKPGALLLITDSGKGMASEVQEQLFVPFYTTKENGIGLGLASVRKIIEAHHGEIWIESVENTGTAVGIILPRTCMI
ncbi:MAG: PAS domain S-box protein [Candidatus Latescibacteria bacterium]|jgi:PAS domain S-box-containing protein|nr:PAS domain S-box protein [Candidatus Latescibacterota bacterium]